MTDVLSISRRAEATPDRYSAIVARSFDRALALDGKLTGPSRYLPGMSGRLYRVFINNLIGDIDDPRYLEVGSWSGSTACAAMEGNALTVVCIDNWSEFGGPKDVFHANVATRLSASVTFRLVEDDFRKVDFAALGKFNVYLFDGPHEKQDQYDGLVKALPALDDVFVFIVDDWNFPRVREGTMEAIAACGCTVLSVIELLTTQDGSIPRDICEHSDWHNGYYIAVVRKAGADPLPSKRRRLGFSFFGRR